MARSGIGPPNVILVIWALVLGSGVLAWLALGSTWRPGGGHPGLLVLAWLVVGVLALVASRMGGDRPPSRTAWPAHALPADGRVEVVRARGVQGEPNGDEPRFQRFVALDPGPGPSPAPARPPWVFPPLRGRVVLMSLFIGRDGRAWTEHEIALAHRSLIRAAEWIGKQAIRWHAPVHLKLGDTFFAADDVVVEDVPIVCDNEAFPTELSEPMESERIVASVSRAVSALGFRDLAHLIDEVQRRLDADQVVWLLHPRRMGHSFAIAPDITPLPGVSLAVCFARESSFPEPLAGSPKPDSVTIAHELLHLFGAMDKYGVELDSFPRGQVTRRDVMVLEFDDSLGRMSIDRLTAREIGWVE